MPNSTSGRYYLIAVLLSAGWPIVLAIPGWTRSWFFGGHGQWRGHLVGLVLAGLILARLFRGRISDARSSAENWRLGILVPYLGCVVYLTIVNLWIWVTHWVHGGLANLHDTLSLYLWGVVGALLACFVVIPYGVFCLWVLSRNAE